MKGLLIKKINKVKLTLTTRCNLACPYCFVKKTNEDMNWPIAKKSIDVLINSRGKEKLLSLYGGEPLINFELIKKICPYAVSQAENKNKKLTISICTNLTLLKQIHLDFFRKYNIKIIGSLVGKKEWQDNVRVFKNQLGTYDLISKKIPMLMKGIKKENLGLSFCIFPQAVNILQENFLHLSKLGFNHINFEIIRYYQPWQENDIRLFVKNYIKIVDYLLLKIKENNFIFINSINWEIKNKYLSLALAGISCPFNYKLEVYPNGQMAFSPFLLNDKDKERYIIGNLDSSQLNMLEFCTFSSKNTLCRDCIKEYFSSPKSDRGAEMTHRYYHLISVKAADFILSKTRYNKYFRDYVSNIKEKICF